MVSHLHSHLSSNRLFNDESLIYMRQPQDILIPDGLTSAPYNILKHDDALVPSALKDALQQNLILAFSFGSTTDPAAVADSVLVIYSEPLKFELYQSGVLQIMVNERSLMHYEQQQSSNSKVKAAAIGESDTERHGGKEVVDYGEDGE